VVVVNSAAVAVKADGAALGHHVDLELAGGAAALLAVVAVTQPVPMFAEQEGDAASRRHADIEPVDIEPVGQRSAELGKGLHFCSLKSMAMEMRA
jgi:hypothetical protein